MDEGEANGGSGNSVLFGIDNWHPGWRTKYTNINV